MEEGVDPHGASRGLIEALTAELEARCTAVRERSGADVRSRVAGGDPAQVILDTARSGGQAGLIATGCRGAGLMTRMRFGSVSNRLLHGSRVPMLIVPAPAATATDGGVS